MRSQTLVWYNIQLLGHKHVFHCNLNVNLCSSFPYNYLGIQYVCGCVCVCGVYVYGGVCFIYSAIHVCRVVDLMVKSSFGLLITMLVFLNTKVAG